MYSNLLQSDQHWKTQYLQVDVERLWLATTACYIYLEIVLGSGHMNLREHYMEWNTQSFSTVYMCKAGWIGNDTVSYKWSSLRGSKNFGCHFTGIVLRLKPFIDSLVCYWNTGTITSLETGSPASTDHFCNASSACANVARPHCIKTRHEARIFHHERHELGGVTSNGEEFETILLHEFFEGWMGRQSYTMTVCL